MNYHRLMDATNYSELSSPSFRPDSLQFGLIPKECQYNFGFDLDTYDNKEDIMVHLERKKYQLTPADHLDHLATDAFSLANGDRPDVSTTLTYHQDNNLG